VNNPYKIVRCIVDEVFKNALFTNEAGYSPAILTPKPFDGLPKGVRGKFSGRSAGGRPEAERF
jgi:hypothetical protein